MNFNALVSPDNLLRVLNSILPNYLKKGDVYSNEEALKIFADKLKEHWHTNLNCLNLLTMSDDNRDVYFNGNKILTSALKPTTYEQHWTTVIMPSDTVILDVKEIFTSNSYTAVISAELNIVNNIQSVNDIEDAKPENQLHLTAIDNSITVLDVSIAPGETQTYELGISNNIQLSVKGNFTANYYMTVY